MDKIKMHEMPETYSDEPEHELSDECWCLPRTEVVHRSDGDIRFIIIHNRITEEKDGRAIRSPTVGED